MRKLAIVAAIAAHTTLANAVTTQYRAVCTETQEHGGYEFR